MAYGLWQMAADKPLLPYAKRHTPSVPLQKSHHGAMLPEREGTEEFFALQVWFLRAQRARTRDELA